jgi:hypothetical protein
VAVLQLWSTSKPGGENPKGDDEKLEPKLGVHRVGLLALVVVPAGPIAGGLGDRSQAA